MNAFRRRSVKRKAGQAQSRGLWFFALGCISALVVAMGAGLMKTQAQVAFPLPAINPPGAKASSGTQATSTAPAAGQPDNKQTGQQTGPQAGQQTAPTAADAQKEAIANQCADLLQMATELKKAVDKSNADTLSVTVVRKASDIEQYAHKLRIANGKS
jgi:type VI protein secretion system component VasF